MRRERLHVSFRHISEPLPADEVLAILGEVLNVVHQTGSATRRGSLRNGSNVDVLRQASGLLASRWPAETGARHLLR